MFEQITFGREFFVALKRIDEEIVQQVAGGACPRCGGPLHRSDYARKPRGALMAAAGEEFLTRFSLCCGRDGCRKRATPPSLRFLGRRVYLGAVVIVASIVARALGAAAAIREATGVPPRTTGRWLEWWRGPFVGTEVFMALRARLVGVAEEELPASLVRRLGDTPEGQVRSLLLWLKPLTTGSGIGSRMLRNIA
jgi:hypothetical protein